MDIAYRIIILALPNKTVTCKFIPENFILLPLNRFQMIRNLSVHGSLLNWDRREWAIQQLEVVSCLHRRF